MTAKPEFTRNISFGNVLVLVGMIVTGTATFVAVDARTQANAAEIARSVAEIDEAALRVADLERRTRALENELARADERFSSILGLLSRIDARLERIERTPDGR
ncbi:hypothetical protein [Pseudooceanicola marinus]|uniref:hypothetical protein n=1 Tax=Pseudooceanicola marinus TaxID=396013 RepID=UPI001CD6D594|nr:hypothetical protein [Pseudooceanicola marinus]MCA1337348.1 hypothetical protein [Pseudooceanicola marinus]